jgi:hypothetical protein
MAEYRYTCFNCSAENVLAHIPGRRDECPKCSADAHVCRNCQNFDRAAYNECREPAADIVREKERSNFCDHFQPGAPGGAGLSRQDALLSAAEALFKKKD